MFDYEKYINEFIKIKEEEIKNCPKNIDEFDDYEKPFMEKRSILNKNNRIIFKHSLKDAWGKPEDEFYILDSDKDNIIIIEHSKKYIYYSLSQEKLESIKKLLSNTILYKKCDVVFPPVLDGTMHQIYISNGNDDIEIECFNLWYWLEEDVNHNNFNATEEEVEYTKELVNIFKEIQKILESNNIKYSILNIEDNEDE